MPTSSSVPDMVKDERGEVVEVRCTYDPDSHTGGPAAGRKVKGTIHWVSAQHAVTAEVRLYDRLFAVPNPSGEDWKDAINPESVEVLACVPAGAEPCRGASGREVPVRASGLFFCRCARILCRERRFSTVLSTLRDSWGEAGQIPEVAAECGKGHANNESASPYHKRKRFVLRPGGWTAGCRRTPAVVRPRCQGSLAQGRRALKPDLIVSKYRAPKSAHWR